MHRWCCVVLAWCELNFTREQQLAGLDDPTTVGDCVAHEFIVAAPTEVAAPDLAVMLSEA